MTAHQNRFPSFCPANDNNAPGRVTVWIASDTPEINAFLTEKRLHDYDGITQARVEQHVYLWGDISETRGVLATLVSVNDEITRLVVKREFLEHKLQRAVR